MELNRSNRFKILIVDDVPKNIQVAASILQNDTYQIAFAQDGPTALAQVESNRFDLILLDIMMPQMDGYEVCRRIRNRPDSRDTPIIFLTAKNDTDSVVKGFAMGAVDYLSKPFNGAELQARVKTHLELYRSRKAIEEVNRRLRLEMAERIKAEEELKRREENYRFLSLHDNLTGLYNTRHLYRSLEKLVEEGRRQGTIFSLIFFDIDNFKRVVDTHGHLNGSKALAEVAAVLESCITEPSYGVAYGGDEFVVVLPGHEKVRALQEAQEIRARLLRTVFLANVENGVRLQASFGVSTYPDDAGDITAILARADQAMFNVKSKGKNAVGDADGAILLHGHDEDAGEPVPSPSARPVLNGEEA
ncbi:MAG: diguanylate cyclase [Desulfobacterales bacterium]|nr:diguanylate cyclase [Desulfobacterales bacterium]